MITKRDIILRSSCSCGKYINNTLYNFKDGRCKSDDSIFCCLVDVSLMTVSSAVW